MLCLGGSGLIRPDPMLRGGFLYYIGYNTLEILSVL